MHLCLSRRFVFISNMQLAESLALLVVLYSAFSFSFFSSSILDEVCVKHVASFFSRMQSFLSLRSVFISHMKSSQPLILLVFSCSAIFFFRLFSHLIWSFCGTRCWINLLHSCPSLLCVIFIWEMELNEWIALLVFFSLVHSHIKEEVWENRFTYLFCCIHAYPLLYFILISPMKLYESSRSFIFLYVFICFFLCSFEDLVWNLRHSWDFFFLSRQTTGKHREKLLSMTHRCCQSLPVSIWQRYSLIHFDQHLRRTRTSRKSIYIQIFCSIKRNEWLKANRLCIADIITVWKKTNQENPNEHSAHTTTSLNDSRNQRNEEIQSLDF